MVVCFYKNFDIITLRQHSSHTEAEEHRQPVEEKNFSCTCYGVDLHLQLTLIQSDNPNRNTAAEPHFSFVSVLHPNLPEFRHPERYSL